MLLQSCGKRLKERAVHLVIDGARDARDECLQDQLLEVFRLYIGKSGSAVVRHDRNLGPRYSIPLGLKLFFSTHENAIVLEDDLIVSELFFDFADMALERRDDHQCSGFSGYMVPLPSNKQHVKELVVRPSNICWPWGWGTDKRAWSCYQDSLEAYSLKDLYKVSRVLSSNSFVRLSWTLLLLLTKQEKNHSWFFRWQLQCCRNRMKFLVPSENLVANAGCDASGTHTSRFTEASGGHILKTADRIVVRSESLSDVKQDSFYTVANGLTATKFVRMIVSALVPNTIFRRARAVLR